MYTLMGAAGNISARLAGLLLEKNQKVRILGRSTERLQSFIDSGAEVAIGDAADSDFLTEAFKEANAVYTMIPVNYTAADYRRYQNEIGQSIARAIERSGVTHVLSLSSLGAHLPDKTGPIKGLHDQEQRLNKLEGTNILHLRPTFFMENMLENIDMIKNMGLNGGHINGDMPFAMIATRDIAHVAMVHILERDFSGKVVKELLGPRDISMKEATRIIGEKIGIPDLTYVHFSRDDYIKGLTQAGLTNDMAQLLAEMSAGLNDIQFGTGLKRTEENTTPTTFEEFAEFFAQVYNR